MSQSYETLLVDRRDRVAVITINRPEKRNALNIKTREEGAALIEELRNDDSIYVVVITGAGDKAFIAGADIGEFAGRSAQMQRDVMVQRSLFNAIDTFPKPVIAMVNGCSSAGNAAMAPLVARAEVPMMLCSILPPKKEDHKWAFAYIPPPAFDVASRSRSRWRRQLGGAVAVMLVLVLSATFALRSITDTSAQERVRDLVLQAYAEYSDSATEAAS